MANDGILQRKYPDSKGETFNDVLFLPQYSEIESRKTVSTTTNLGKFSLDLPLISANMKDITGPKMAATMAQQGGLGILHRFGYTGESLSDFQIARGLIEKCNDFIEGNGITSSPKWMSPIYSVGVSIGVKAEDKCTFIMLRNEGARLFCIDVAHGHHILVKQMIQYIRDNDKVGDICIIAGNVATVEGAIDLKNWGADIVKTGIGPGSRCETRKNTGVGVPQLKAIREIRMACPDLPIISDGGIKYCGDIPKALKYANAVMVGSFIAGTSETPGNVYQNDREEFYKVYGGSASGERKVENGKEHSFIEGMVKEVPFRGKVKFILRKAKNCIQSSLSYSGCKDLTTFRDKAILVDIGSGAKNESKL